MSDLSRSDLFKLHIDMWKHYNGLRQGKTNAFLTVNSSLVAITGFLMREPTLVALVRLISALGIGVCASWFLLLLRNSAYIDYHRIEAGQGQPLWKPPKAGRIPSKWLDSIPSVVFFAFWVGVLVFVRSTK